VVAGVLARKATSILSASAPAQLVLAKIFSCADTVDWLTVTDALNARIRATKAGLGMRLPSQHWPEVHTVAAEPKTVALTSGATGPPSSREMSAPGT
jgi:hypothetical protein